MSLGISTSQTSGEQRNEFNRDLTFSNGLHPPERSHVASGFIPVAEIEAAVGIPQTELSGRSPRDGRGTLSGRNRSSKFYDRVGSFVAGLHGYGIAGRRRSSRKQIPSDSQSCTDCHGLLDATSSSGGGRVCVVCQNGEAGTAYPPTQHAGKGSEPFLNWQESSVQSPTQQKKAAEYEMRKWRLGSTLDPRAPRMKMWTRGFFIVAGLSLFTDPCYLYSLTFTIDSSCLYLQKGLAVFATCLAVICYTCYAVQSYLSFRTAYVSQESLFLGRGELIMNARAIAHHHFFSMGGFLLDVLVLIPVPQLLIFVFIPVVFDNIMQAHEGLSVMLGLVFVSVIIQYALKVCHTFVLAARTQRINGYVFGTVWWGFVLNFTIFIITAHALGALWYLETVSSATACLHGQCTESGPGCSYSWLVCSRTISASPPAPDSAEAYTWGGPNSNTTAFCFTTGSGGWNYGIYNDAVQLLQEGQPAEKIMYGIFFGMMTMATFGNALVPAPDIGQAIFSFLFVIFGLLLFTTLIGNIGVFLTNVTARMDEMRMRRKNMDWWMRKRQLPEKLQAKVRQQERLNFVATRGMDEGALLNDLPTSLKRQVKRHLCGRLVRSVPLFRSLDDLVVDSICVKLKPCVLIYGMEIVRQGDPVQEMLFILKGRIRSTHTMTGGAKSSCDLGPGSYCGEELLSWTLSKDIDQIQLPAANATLTADSVLEMFALSATDLRFIVSHFRSHLRERRLRWLIKYYSPHWRAWAAVTIQLWWRRRKRMAALSLSRLLSKAPSRDSLGSNNSSQMYTTLLRAAPPRPQDSLGRSLSHHPRPSSTAS